MAEDSRGFNEGGILKTKDPLKFEKVLKERLKWSKTQWADLGDGNIRFQKLCNSLNYWKVKLKPALEETSIILTLYNEERDSKTDLLDIIRAMESMERKITVKGTTDFRNPRYVCFYFQNQEDKNYVMQNFKLCNNSYVVFLSWALGPSVTELRVHWLPMTLELDIIKKHLDKYVTFLEEERVFLNLMDGRDMPTGKVNFKVTFKEGIKAESVPHLTCIAEMEALITVQGRLPLCLTCNCLGHISRNCKMRFCSKCRVLQSPDHLCTGKLSRRTYAQVAKVDELEVEVSDWAAEVSSSQLGPLKVGGSSLIEIKKQELSAKISELEKQLTEPVVNITGNKKKKNRKRKVAALVETNEGGLGVFGSHMDEHSEDNPVSQATSDGMDTDEDGEGDLTPGPFGVEGAGAFSPSLSQEQVFFKTFGKSKTVLRKEQKAQKLFDKIVEDRVFVFKDD